MSAHGHLATFVLTYADGSREEIEAHRYTFELAVDGSTDARFYPFPEDRSGLLETIDRRDVVSIDVKA